MERKETESHEIGQCYSIGYYQLRVIVMEPTSQDTEHNAVEAIQEATEILDQVSNYSGLIGSSLFLIIGGMVIVFILYKLTARFLFPYIRSRRLIRVVFGTLYVLILVVAMLMVLERLGVETKTLGGIVISLVLVGAVIAFFLVPFLPRLPFKIGQMIEVNGILGTVDTISTLHTTIRTFDGEMVFLPNPMVLASRITNYSDLPQRRIKLEMTVSLDADLEKVFASLTKIMTEEPRVVDVPAPAVVRVKGAAATGITVVAFCWTANELFLDVQSDLWRQVVTLFNSIGKGQSLVLPQQEIHIVNE